MDSAAAPLPAQSAIISAASILPSQPALNSASPASANSSTATAHVSSQLVLDYDPPTTAGLASSASTQTVADLRRLLPSEIGNWKISEPDRIFTRDTVAEYAGKTADILLGFPFRMLLVREYLSDQSLPPLTAEVYDMSTSGDAFGIFSHDLSGEPLSVGHEALYKEGTLRFWKGNIFARIIAGSDTPESKSLAVALGLRAAESIIREGARPKILSALPAGGLDPGTVRYFHTQASLNLHYYLADQNVLLLNEDTEVALGKYRAGWSRAMLLICRYLNPQDAYQAFRRFSRDYFPGNPNASARRIVAEIEYGEFAAAFQTDAFLILVLEAPDRESCESLLRGAESGIRAVFPGKS